MTVEQLDLFAPAEVERYDPGPGFFGPELLDTGAVFTFQVACHQCWTIVAVIPVDDGTPLGEWRVAEKFGYLAHVEHEREAHPRPVRSAS